MSGEVHWRCRQFSSEWQECVPLPMLIPYPTRCATWSDLRTVGIVSLITAGLSALMIWRHGLTTATVATCIVTLVVILGGVILVIYRGPTEWVTFDTFFPEKSIYFYRTAADDTFDEFVGQLQARIASQSAFGDLSSCGTSLCEPTAVSDPRSGGVSSPEDN